MIFNITSRVVATKMTPSDGLQRLSEYLAQTRRQANAAIDILNTKVKELQSTNSELRQRETSLRLERDDYYSQLKLLRAENYTKYQLRERDDWKAVLDNVQKDRNRLFDECEALKMQLNDLRCENERLQREVELHDGKLILGMTSNHEAFEQGKNFNDTEKHCSSSVVKGSSEWARTYVEMSQLGKQFAISTSVYGVPAFNYMGENIAGSALWDLWYMMFGRDHVHAQDTNHDILIV